MQRAHIFLLLVLSACSAKGQDRGFETLDEAGASGASGGLGGADGGKPGSSPGGAPLLYAHTDTSLYQLDPDQIGGPLTKLGDFDCVGTQGPAKSMTDVAVAKDGKLYGVSEGAAFPLTVQGSVVHCETTWPLPQTKFYGLTVAPENTVAAAEVLIAADGLGGLYQIDATSGVPVQVGTLGDDPKTNTPWALSGDIVFLANGGNPVGFATVRTCSAKGGKCSAVDTLIEVDIRAIKPGTGSVLKSIRGLVTKGAWCTNASSPQTFGGMFGIVAYKDVVYGFSRQGDIVEIRNSDGSGCLVSNDPTLHWAGAGITTTAPVVAPTVK